MHKQTMLFAILPGLFFASCGPDLTTEADANLARADAAQNATDDASLLTSDAGGARDSAQNPDAGQSQSDAALPDHNLDDRTTADDAALMQDATTTLDAELGDNTNDNTDSGQQQTDAGQADSAATIPDAGAPDLTRPDTARPDTSRPDATPPPSLNGDETVLVQRLYGIPDSIATDMHEYIVMLGFGILFCGQQDSTLTEDSNGLWTCSTAPAGTMVYNYYNGRQITYLITYVDGYLQGTAYNFADSHLAAFEILDGNSLDLNIFSVTSPDAQVSGKIDWSRSAVGNEMVFAANTEINLSDNGHKKSEVSGSYASYDITHNYSGSATASTMHLYFDESRRSLQMHDSNNATHAMNFWRVNNGSAELNGHSYGFDSLGASWATGSVLGDPGTFDKVIDSNFWDAQGSFSRDGQAIAQVVFDAAIVENNPGPNLALRPQVGDDIILEQTTDSP